MRRRESQCQAPVGRAFARTGAETASTGAHREVASVRCRRRAHIDRCAIRPDHVLGASKPPGRVAKSNLCRTREVARWGHFHGSGAAEEEVGFLVRARCGGGTRHRPPTNRVVDRHPRSRFGKEAAHHAPESAGHMEDARKRRRQAHVLSERRASKSWTGSGRTRNLCGQCRRRDSRFLVRAPHVPCRRPLSGEKVGDEHRQRQWEPSKLLQRVVGRRAGLGWGPKSVC